MKRKETIISALIALVCIVFAAESIHAASSIPRVNLSVKPLDLSQPPTTNDLMAAGQLGGQLYPTGAVKDKTRAGKINLSFGEAIETWNRHEYNDAVVLFRKHVEEFPDSPWAAESVLHVGCNAYYNGRYTEAEESFKWIIDTFRGRRHEGAKLLIDKSVLRLANLRVVQNRFEEARGFFRGLKKTGLGWRERTYASHWIQRLSRYRSKGLAMLDCGTKALARLLDQSGREVDARKIAGMLPDTLRGHSMKNLSEIAAQFGYDVEAVRFSPAEMSLLPLPAIVHIDYSNKNKSGHYRILEKVAGNSLTLFDPQEGRHFQQGVDEFMKESSGSALVFNSSHDILPGIALSDSEKAQVFGGCCGVPRPEDDLGDPCKKSGGGGASSGRSSVSSAPSSGSCGGNSKGSPVWSVNEINMNLYMQDTPLWYDSFIGPSVQVQISYNAQSAIAHNEPFGNKWQFNYGSYLVVDTAGVVTIFMPDGRRDSYSPDGQGGYTRPYNIDNTLTRIAANNFQLKFPGGNIYVYKIPAGTTSLQPFLVEVHDARGRKLTMTYDANIHLTEIADALGKKTVLTYNASGLVSKATDPFGRSASFVYDAKRNLTKITDMGGYSTTLSYDADVYLKSLQTGPNKWNFYTEPADALDNASNAYPAPGGAMWDDYRITVTNPSGGKEEFYYDGFHGSGWYVSPRFYVPYQNSNVNNYRSDAPKIMYNYVKTSGQQGEISKITLPEGASYSFTYDTNGNMLTETDSHANKNSYTYGLMGNIISTVDPNLTTTTYLYASNGVDLTEITNGLGTVTLTYNAFYDVTSVTDRLGNKKSFTYNTYSQKTSETDEMGVITTYTYNVAHQLSNVVRSGKTLASYTYDVKGRVKTYTAADGVTVTFAYNNLDEITKITYPDAKFETVAYSTATPHLITSVTERSGLTTSYTYDSLGQLTMITDPAGGITKIIRDENGNMTQLLDHYGEATSFEYDRDDRLVRKTYANGASQIFTYDYDQLYRVTDARNYYATYYYDKNLNLKSVYYAGGNTPNVSYQYDLYNRLTGMTDAMGSTTFTYDANSNLKSIDGPLANDTLTFNYDAKGRRMGYSLLGGKTVSYAYDTLDRVINIQGGTQAYTYAYPGASTLVQKLARPNNSFTVYQRDTVKRLTSIANKDASAAVIGQYDYSYDTQDRRASEIVTKGPSVVFPAKEAVSYVYNDINQLLSSTGPVRAYAYDSDGNMTAGYTPQGYAFTATYDAENRLTSLQYTDSSTVVHKTDYIYNGFGFLARKKEYSGATLTDDTFYVRLGSLVLQERDGGNAVAREYTWGLNMGGGIGGLLNLAQGGQDYSYLYDGKGNVTALLNSSQTVVASYTYDPFGKRLSKTGSIEQPYQFSTKPYDEETGFSYYGYRYYLPAIGKWITRDPIGERGGMNLYGFVGNNPVDLIDPLGLECPEENSLWKNIRDYFWKKGTGLEKKPTSMKEYEDTSSISKKNTPSVDRFSNPLRDKYNGAIDALAGQ